MAYQPTAIPDDCPEGLKTWLSKQLRLISSEFKLYGSLRLKVLGAEPSKVQDGMLVYADGSNWDPGAGAGFYGREGGSWVKL